MLGMIKSSKDIKERNVKMLFFGASGTRKTETVLRNFPDVLIIDTEGNAAVCQGVPEIPEFLLATTKDVRKVAEIIKAVSDGKIKFSDGRLVQTLFIDSASVLWSVQKEVASMMAEGRAAKYNRPIETATVTQLDWVTAKRPMKTIYTMLANSPIRFIIFSAREADDYKDDPNNKGQQIKVGLKPDVMGGLDYEMNIVLRFGYTHSGEWEATVEKSQGSLSSIFPLHKRMSKFPIKEILDYAKTLQTSEGTNEDELTIAKGIVDETITHTEKDMIAYANEKGIPTGNIGAILKAAGFSAFDPKKYTEMLQVIDKAAIQQ